VVTFVKLCLKRSRSGFETYGFQELLGFESFFKYVSQKPPIYFDLASLMFLKRKLRSFTCLPVILFGDWKEKTKENFLNLL
jgi:hypothetical protein